MTGWVADKARNCGSKSRASHIIPGRKTTGSFMALYASRRQLGPDRKRAQLGIGDLGIDRPETGKRAKTAIAACDYPVRPDDPGKAVDPLRHHFGVLDEIGCRIDHAGHQHHVVWDLGFAVAEHGPLM